MDAHRQRESKWMALISTWPPAQAYQSKKVLREAVPSSVCYLVWVHLTCSRGGVPASGEIEKDMGSRFF
ncbi:uncharacterized protein LACBIDRAFT_303354 [Laccaria bicolor S238N-H82]|uniref:Predicted protein n=1 Tax=Laccaria bicolor (strain S238N-H82 / ATCC MYA-4686) TaxID=486041 RepID=B0DJD3_LACBS|nr:uncharacterized protein LACBIDRAFT_303354 [Laccaria bicolor S238N-H82]EDR05500.1 predicted protein [Laccaria bicolor S238N-H82]|eukprot:XP_001884058.1 predicted protein [Laccaria bicolor S238N-H82]